MQLRRRLLPAVSCLTAALGMCGFPALAQTSSTPPLDGARALDYFAQIDSLTRRDGGRLWGLSLAGPILLVDRASRAVVANQPDTEGRLLADGAIFRGTLPADQNVANTAFNWGGRRWTMVALPLPDDPAQRGALLLHELWHRLQDSLGFPASSPSNEHLGRMDGRLWLRLEGHALAAALGSSGKTRTKAIADALAFRRYRRSLIPGADSSERALELNEGLAEYTGLTLAGFTGARGAAEVAARLAGLDTLMNFARSFAYLTGPAYGLLLDATGVTWRRSLRLTDDLAERLGAALRLKALPPAGATIEQRAGKYGYTDLRAAEESRELARATRQSELRQRFVLGPVVRLPLREMRVGFDPYAVESLDSVGTVYGTLRIVDRWGVLEVSSGGGLIKDWMEAVVPGPAQVEGSRAKGPGWTLNLEPGWRLVTGVRKGDLTVLEAR